VEGDDQFTAWIVRGAASKGRWRGAERAGLSDARDSARRPSQPRRPTGGSPRAAPQSRREARLFTILFR
jgi:hypothetical protein